MAAVEQHSLEHAPEGHPFHLQWARLRLSARSAFSQTHARCNVGRRHVCHVRQAWSLGTAAAQQLLARHPQRSQQRVQQRMVVSLHAWRWCRFVSCIRPRRHEEKQNDASRFARLVLFYIGNGSKIPSPFLHTSTKVSAAIKFLNLGRENRRDGKHLMCIKRSTLPADTQSSRSAWQLFESTHTSSTWHCGLHPGRQPWDCDGREGQKGAGDAWEGWWCLE